MLLYDTSILIDYFRQYPPAFNYFQNLSACELNISIITAMEILAGAEDKKSLNVAQDFLDKFRIYAINVQISKKALILIKKYHLSDSLDLPDSLIAATALYYQADLVTRNIKHFQIIPGIKLKSIY